MTKVPGLCLDKDWEGRAVSAVPVVPQIPPTPVSLYHGLPPKFFAKFFISILFLQKSLHKRWVWSQWKSGIVTSYFPSSPYYTCEHCAAILLHGCLWIQYHHFTDFTPQGFLIIFISVFFIQKSLHRASEKVVLEPVIFIATLVTTREYLAALILDTDQILKIHQHSPKVDCSIFIFSVFFFFFLTKKKQWRQTIQPMHRLKMAPWKHSMIPGILLYVGAHLGAHLSLNMLWTQKDNSRKTSVPVKRDLLVE